ncbi:MAG: hypothetical protein WBC80_02630 [Isosphaeraceae bacterium]
MGQAFQLNKDWAFDPALVGRDRHVFTPAGLDLDRIGQDNPKRCLGRLLAIRNQRKSRRRRLRGRRSWDRSGVRSTHHLQSSHLLSSQFPERHCHQPYQSQ